MDFTKWAALRMQMSELFSSDITWTWSVSTAGNSPEYFAAWRCPFLHYNHPPIKNSRSENVYHPDFLLLCGACVNAQVAMSGPDPLEMVWSAFVKMFVDACDRIWIRIWVQLSPGIVLPDTSRPLPWGTQHTPCWKWWCTQVAHPDTDPDPPEEPQLLGEC